jgi:hypothetical protein
LQRFWSQKLEKIFLEGWELRRQIIELGAEKNLDGKRKFFAVNCNFGSVGRPRVRESAVGQPLVRAKRVGDVACGGPRVRLGWELDQDKFSIGKIGFGDYFD